MDLTARVEALEQRVAYLEQQLQLQQSGAVNPDRVNSQDAAEFSRANAERSVYVARPQPTVRPENHTQSAINANTNTNADTNINADSNMNLTPKSRQPVGRTLPNGSVPGMAKQKPAKQKSTDMESFIGKNVFVVVASVLIFVGLIVFAAAIMPYLSAEIKFAAMVIGSIALTAVGVLLSRRRQSVFNVSLLACGLGAIYITLFTGKIYFKFIADIPLYISLLIWCMVVFFCSRYKSILFNIIGQSGILISLIMGTASVLDSGESMMALFLAIYVVIAQILYNSLYKSENYLINSVSALLSSIILSSLVHNLIDATAFHFDQAFSLSAVVTILEAMLFLLLIFVLVRNIIYAKSEAISKLSYVITGYMIYFSQMIITHAPGVDNNTEAYITAAFGILLFAAMEYLFLHREGSTAVAIFSAVVPCISVFCCYFTEHSFCSALVIPCLIAVYLRIRGNEYGSSRFTLPCTTLFGAFISTVYLLQDSFTFWENSEAADPFNALYLLTGIIFILLICLISQPENEFDKIALYLSLLTVMLIQIPASPEAALLMTNRSRILLCVCLMLLIQLYYRLMGNLYDRERPPFSQATFVCFFTVNALCMLYSLYALHYFSGDPVYYAITLAAAAGLFSLNVLNLMSSDNSGLSPYVGIKYTILVIAAASEFGNKPVTSILLFILAIACLISGQKLKQKPLRLYALILALLSTIKLLMFDISYDNLVMRAFSLIVCGALCFGISLFYTRLEKSNRED